MPRVYLNENDRISKRLSAWVYGEMKNQRISQVIMAKELGISQQALSMKLKIHSFSFSDFLGFIRVLQPDEKELSRLLGR